VVNESLGYEDGVTDKEVGEILVKLRLSKPSILESKDKLKRARDHLFNASFLGLMIPSPADHGYRYFVSPVGRLLRNYRFEDPCPSDTFESTIFIDRLLRMKLTNSYDLRHTYRDYRTRPFLSILAILNTRVVHMAHIHLLLGERRDLILNKEVLHKYLDIFSKFSRLREKQEVERFLEEFNLNNQAERQEILRSTKPLLDWLRQVNLIHIDDEGWCTIKDYGTIAFKKYSALKPIWYQDLGFDAPTQSAVLLMYMIAKNRNLRVNPNKLRGIYKDALNELAENFTFFNKNKTRIVENVDFDFYYDVPVKFREEVLEKILEMSSMLGMNYTRERLLNELVNLSISTIKILESELRKSAHDEILNLSEALGFEIPRPEWFQTEFEWKVCVRLRELNFNTYPYNGEFEGSTDLLMASDNPDMIIREDNRLLTLVECKSSKEWGKILKLNKRVAGEFMSYQIYAEDIKANSVLFVCESEMINGKFTRLFSEKVEPKADKIVVCSWRFLDKARSEPQRRNRLLNVMTNPSNCSPDEKLLFDC